MLISDCWLRKGGKREIFWTPPFPRKRYIKIRKDTFQMRFLAEHHDRIVFSYIEFIIIAYIERVYLEIEK